MGSPPRLPSEPHRHRKPRIKLPATILCVAGLIFYSQFVFLPRFISGASPNALRLSQFQLDHLDAGLLKCAQLNTPPIRYELPVSSSRANPRWNPSTGQRESITLRNATLFDGESFVGAVDIQFTKGVIVSVSPTSVEFASQQDPSVIDLNGKYVTPGLIDMHSHHLVGLWPDMPPANDINEVHPSTGPLTPFVRALDGMKPDDAATRIIASGGITSSLILPGSANIMGGEGFMVKNSPNSGPFGEDRVEDLLLEHGIPQADRRRYLKMACGENPKGLYSHTRMGNSWIFRHHMERTKELVEKQDAWCLSAAAAKESRDAAAIAALVEPSSNSKGGLPEELELDSSVALLRGKIGVNIHCYEPEDFEDMLLHSKEFNFRIQAFHHALSAWKVPEMIKESEENITIATFSTFGLYKKEAYDSNLWAGKILADHGVPVAYKSDHSSQETNAKYLLFQAATAHSFHLPEDLALQSVTSVPAKSLELDHRIGYVRVGYDADIVVFDSHPLSVGATPLQVYIDGRATLDDEGVAETFSAMHHERSQDQQMPKMRTRPESKVRNETCRQVTQGKTVIRGITKSYLQAEDGASSASGNYTLVLDSGKAVCFNSQENCISHSSGGHVIELENGHVLPGLTAVFTGLGMGEIATEDSTADGSINQSLSPLDPESVVFARYGVHLEGRAFERARIGGVTRSVSTPVANGFLRGVSVGIETIGQKTILDGGIFKDDVALHFTIGQSSKGSESTPTISSAVALLRRILSENKEKDNIYGRAVNGSLPLVVHAENKYDITQLIKIKQSFPSLNLVIYGGAESAAVAAELAESKIPVILTTARPSPDNWEKKDALSGPPLTRSPVSVLHEAGVSIALGSNSFVSDSAIHERSIEASWAAKYAGLSDHEAVDLVSRNIETILDLGVVEAERDFVVWEGDPLQFGASVVLAVDGVEKSVTACWPESN